MIKANLKIVSLLLLLQLALLNASLAQPGKCAADETMASMPCCSTLTLVHKAIDSNLSSALCGCNMSPGQTVPAAANATLIETTKTAKSIDNHTILCPKHQLDIESARPSIKVRGRLPLSKSVTSQKIYTLISSFLI